MADIVDIANAAADSFLQDAIRRNRNAPPLERTGRCKDRFCGEELPDLLSLFCDTECRDNYERSLRTRRK